jgi:uncharacterized membrane protein
MSEALCILAFFTPAAIPGLSVGCLLFNLTFSAALPLDFLLGTLATLLATQLMWLTRRMTVGGFPLIGMLLPALTNAILVGWELTYYIGSSFFLNALYVAIGEAAVIEAATQYDLGLITDRTQADVSNKTAKGFYQASDLNRVGDAMNYVAGVFNENGYIVEIAPRTDWTDNEWPTPSSMAHYLDCLSVLRGVIAVYRSTPEVPATMEKLNYKTANEIETILVDIDWLLNHIYAAYRHCGVTICGEGGLIL